ncbi:DUF3486 family protein [Rahnella contaminans]|uniref:DUF3486 family protein n=1 Tax=Rahnella contaminans TaxID=2703882 RepID=UPI003C2BA4E1
MTKKDKATRGRASKIDLLPESIQREINTLLSNKKNTQEDIRSAINELIDKAGLSEEMKLSRSGLNRYTLKMESAGTRIREMNEISKQWIDQIGVESSGDTSRLLIQIVRGLAFDVSLKMQSGDQAVEPKGLKELATAIEKLEKSASEGYKREQEIRRQMAAEAADAAATAGKAAGLTAEGVATIKAQILGLAV